MSAQEDRQSRFLTHRRPFRADKYSGHQQAIPGLRDFIVIRIPTVISANLWAQTDEIPAASIVRSELASPLQLQLTRMPRVPLT
jgi:hypothetical protein